jgi:hypothetical protein
MDLSDAALAREIEHLERCDGEFFEVTPVYLTDAIDLLRQAVSDRAELVALRATVAGLEAARKLNDALRCSTCGTAAYQPNERCADHLSWADRLATARTMQDAWTKRAYQAERETAALEAARDKALEFCDAGISSEEPEWACFHILAILEGRDVEATSERHTIPDAIGFLSRPDREHVLRNLGWSDEAIAKSEAPLLRPVAPDVKEGK